MSKSKHILVIRLSAMGDVAMSVPVLRVFSEMYPEVKLTVLSRAFFKPLFEDIPNLDFLEADVYGKHKGFFGLIRLAKEALALNIDAVADLHQVIRSKIITDYLKLKGLKTARIDKGRREKKVLTSGKNTIFTPLKTTHKRYAEVFKKLGFPIDLKEYVPPKKKSMNSKLMELAGVKHQKLIGIAPFAAHEGKAYPLSLMTQVIDRLNNTKKYKILLFGGGKQEIERLESLAEKFSEVVSIAGKITFEEELALISNLDLMISMDSGNGHLAAIYGIPVLTLWGVTHPFAGFAPFNQSEQHQLLSDREKYPLIPTSIYGNKIPPGYEKVMETITPEMVFKRVKEIL